MNKNVMQYIRNVVDLEKSVYLQIQAINCMKSKISCLEQPQTYTKPDLPYTDSVDIGGALGVGFLGLVIGAPAALVSGEWLLLLMFPLVFGGVTLAIMTINVKKENAERWKRYHTSLQQYNQAVAADQIRLNCEKSEKIRLEHTLKYMTGKLQDTQKLLRQYYDANVIYPKYRNLVAMCSIYDYLVSGRCTELTGHEGAYNKFDYEAQMGVIIAKLDTVIHKLEYIRQSQYMLYDAIQAGNRMSQQLIEQSARQIGLAQETVENTELGLHYQQQIANEASQMKWLMAFGL